MKVSVIVPNYNHAKYLVERIDSILDQTFQDFELIILDDCSTDNSREIINEYASKYPGIRTIYNDTNSGNPFSQWNRGVAMAGGEYIWIAESDDVADMHFLEKTLREIGKSGSTGMVYCDTIVLNEEKRIRYKYSERSRSKNTVKKLTIRSMVENPIPNVSSVLFRKEAFLTGGGGDTVLKYCGDWALYQRILRSWDIVYLPEALSTFRLHDRSGYHDHYHSNTILKEKIRIYTYMFRNHRITPSVFFRMLTGFGKTLILRLIHMLRLPGWLMPELPRRPGKCIITS